MKKIVTVGCFILLLGLGERVTYACSCAPPKPSKLNVKKFKRWFNEFNGAIFIGRAIKVELKAHITT